MKYALGLYGSYLLENRRSKNTRACIVFEKYIQKYKDDLTLSKACSIVMVMKCKFLRVLKHTFKYTLWNVEKAFIYSTTGRTQHLR